MKRQRATKWPSTNRSKCEPPPTGGGGHQSAQLPLTRQAAQHHQKCQAHWHATSYGHPLPNLHACQATMACSRRGSLDVSQTRAIWSEELEATAIIVHSSYALFQWCQKPSFQWHFNCTQNLVSYIIFHLHLNEYQKYILSYCFPST